MGSKQSAFRLLVLGIGLIASTSFAQQDKMGGMKGMDMKQDKMGDMKGMDMKSCNEMMGMKGMDMKQCMEMMNQKDKTAKSTSGTHKASGVVTKVDSANGTVTFDHGPVKSMNWPAMSMGFTVKDKKLLEKLSVGKKVSFEFKQEGSEYVVTSAK